METPDGMVELHPPQPAFSIKGRTVQSMLRLMRDWHRSLGVGGAGLWIGGGAITLTTGIIIDTEADFSGDAGSVRASISGW